MQKSDIYSIVSCEPESFVDPYWCYFCSMTARYRVVL